MSVMEVGWASIKLSQVINISCKSLSTNRGTCLIIRLIKLWLWNIKLSLWSGRRVIFTWWSASGVHCFVSLQGNRYHMPIRTKVCYNQIKIKVRNFSYRNTETLMPSERELLTIIHPNGHPCQWVFCRVDTTICVIGNLNAL